MGHLLILLLSLLAALSGCVAGSETVAVEGNETHDSPGDVVAPVAPTQPLEETSEEIAMKEAIESYVNGADRQQVELVDMAFHNDFQVFAYSEGNVRVLDKTTYLELLSAGKIGGSRREIRYLDLYINGPIGTARVDLVGEDVTFRDHLSLILEDGNWKIIANVTQVVPNP